jgi:hypothetical protein
MTIGLRIIGTFRAFFISSGAVASCARFVLVALVGVGLVSWLDPVIFAQSTAGVVWRNALPVSLLAVLIYALSGRLLFSIWLTGGMTWLIFMVNALKERNMNVPLTPSDWVLRDQLFHNMAFFSHYTANGLLVTLGGFLFVAVCWALWWWERRWARPALFTRGVWTLVSVALLYTVFHGDRPWGDAYSDKAMPGFAVWSPVKSVKNVGLMAALVRMTHEARIKIPAGNPSVVADFAQAHAESLAARAKRPIPSELPDIVVIQSEAFFDPGILKGIEFGEFSPNFERLSATGITGPLVTPAYGGGTIRTEFETLTGYPMFAFPAVTYPYFGLVKNWMPSVPRRLQQFGYSTTLFHPYHPDFWNRQQVMPMLGFQHSYYEDAFAGSPRVGYFVSDRGLFDFVLKHLEHEGAAPSYSMLITMENHGLWAHDAVELPHVLDGHSVPSGLSAKGTTELTYYLSHLVNGDAALGDFVQRLMARPRWTIVLFYGDHLPSLNEAFRDLGFDNGETYTEQHTRYMLISNRPTGFKPANPDMALSAYELPGLLFDAVGLPADGYLAFDGAIREARKKELPEQNAHYGQIAFDAALLEVHCKARLTAAGTCQARHAVAAPRATP